MIDEIWERLRERSIEVTIIISESLTKFGRGDKWYRNKFLDDFLIGSVLNLVIPSV